MNLAISVALNLNTSHASENRYTARAANAADRKFKSEVHQFDSELLTAFAECVNKNETETKKKLVWNRLAVRSSQRWIDPNSSGHNGWAGRMMDKALRMGKISRG
jgi:uncharacterized protein YecT (DUF1311 family)